MPAFEFLLGFGCVTLLYVLFVIQLLASSSTPSPVGEGAVLQIFNEHHNYHINIVLYSTFLKAPKIIGVF